MSMREIPAGWVKLPNGEYAKPNSPLVSGHASFTPYQGEQKFTFPANFGKEVVKKKKTRIRQETKPLMNKLESSYLTVLNTRYPNVKIHAQSWRVKIANGAWFKVDFCAFVNGRWTAWECKGPSSGKNVDRGLLALKCAASQFSEVDWNLVWKEGGIWQEQKVLN